MPHDETSHRKKFSQLDSILEDFISKDTTLYRRITYIKGYMSTLRETKNFDISKAKTCSKYKRMCLCSVIGAVIEFLKAHLKVLKWKRLITFKGD